MVRFVFYFGLLVFVCLPSITLLASKSEAIAGAQERRGDAGSGQRPGETRQSPTGTPSTQLNGLNPFRSLIVTGDYVAAGTGLRDTTQGSISISGIPAGASIVEAYLYWGMLADSESPALRNLNFNGTPLAGTLVGSGLDTNWGRAASFAYRATVTSLVSGSPTTYALTGVASGGSILAQGASLIIIYERPGDPFRSVVLLNGDVVFKNSDDAASTAISGFVAAAPVSAKTTFIVGDGQDFPDSASFTGGAGTSTFINPFDGSDGRFWDTDTFTVSSAMNPGDTTATARIPRIGDFIGDALMWVAQAFSVTTNPPFDVCIQDDSNANLFLQFNSTTGNYHFTNCAGFTLGGTGTLVLKGGIITLEHNAADRRVLARIDKAARKATASVEIPSRGFTFVITDRNTANDSCVCSN